jgi:hypothetical protein
MSADPPTISRGRRWLYVAILAALPLLALVLLEGAASFVLLLKDLGTTTANARLHTTYDSLLGWASTPNLALPDYYGPGRALHTDSAGRRWTGEPRAGSLRRVVCVGDSFTFGHGVGDRDTWCERLTAGDSAAESVNLGQVGFGVDQAYLWYRRDGRPLQPEVVLFAFVKADFNRMKAREFLSIPKPRLALRGDSLVAIDVPVRQRGAVRRWLDRTIQKLQALRLWELASRARGGPPGEAVPDSAVWTVARRAFMDIAGSQRARDARFAAVLLPAESDYTGRAIVPWHDRLRADADSGHYDVIDLWEDFIRLPPDSVPMLFIHESDGIPHNAHSHYTPAGNAWVAERIRARLAALPPVSLARRTR